MRLSATPPHTIGPFFHGALGWTGTDTAEARSRHGSIEIEGVIEDATGAVLPAWLLEAWVPQGVAAEAGLVAPGLRRVTNDAGGRFSFRVHAPLPGEPAAFVTLFGLGLVKHQFSAVFLEDAGPLLDPVPAERRNTLVAERIDATRYRWTIRTQGDRETVFFDYR